MEVQQRSALLFDDAESFSLVVCRDEYCLLPPSLSILLGNVSSVKILKPPSLKQEDRAGGLEQLQFAARPVANAQETRISW